MENFNFKSSSSQFRILVFILGIFISLAIFFVNQKFIESSINFTLFYEIPIIIVCWYSRTDFAIALAVLCVSEWSFINIIRIGINKGLMVYIFDILIRLFMYLFIIFILSRLKINSWNEKALARKDNLTGVYNLNGFYELMNLELYKMKRYKKPITLAYLDIDNFKKINDRFGHSSGNDVLVKLTKIIQGNIRKSDFIARLGGDEFIIVYPDMDIQRARIAIDKIRNVVSDQMKSKSLECFLSIGVGIFNNWDKSIDDMISVVDQLMYKVKNSTKNDVLLMEYEQSDIIFY
jgi:diguanylate cyclase (GGDEF)-like protein